MQLYLILPWCPFASYFPTFLELQHIFGVLHILLSLSHVVGPKRLFHIHRCHFFFFVIWKNSKGTPVSCHMAGCLIVGYSCPMIWTKANWTPFENGSTQPVIFSCFHYATGKPTGRWQIKGKTWVSEWKNIKTATAAILGTRGHKKAMQF